MPLENHTDLFIQRILYHDHRYLHNYDTLSRALVKCGFSKVRKAVPGDTIVRCARESLHNAEKGRDRWEVIVEAQKGDAMPQVERFNEKRPVRYIARLLASVLNIAVSKYEPRRPAFSSRWWFNEKVQMCRQYITDGKMASN